MPKMNTRKALNRAFLKVKPARTEIECFKKNLIQLLDTINESESEEFHKNITADFLKNTYFMPNYFINTKGRNDLVIHTGKNPDYSVGVIIEAKKPANKAEMIHLENINGKALQELLLYFLRERITGKNFDIKHLIATNIYEWFIFDANQFETLFVSDKKLIENFIDFEEKRLTGISTDFFYNEIAKPSIAKISEQIEFTYFDMREYSKPLRNADPSDDNALVALYKIFSPEHLLKLPFQNDSNSLDKTFYTEFLHLIGLVEKKEGGKKLIDRKKEGERSKATLIENTISQLDSLDKIARIENQHKYGNTRDEKLFNVALELVITWINRILFLKLLEAQLINYHKGNIEYAFLNIEKIQSYDDLNALFFSILAKKQNERDEELKKAFNNVPYLNSSLFEPTELEQIGIFISNLNDRYQLPIHSSTVLKDKNGNKRKGELPALAYIFEFLDAYDFSSEGSEEIQEDNKTLINASVLGLIFEKINGYKEGSFFTPGFITMYMCRETIRRAVLQKFNRLKTWNCSTLTELYNKIENKKEANEIINSLKLCDPAVGSGHFLVSALNEIIAIKAELKILMDREDKTLRDYHFEVVNDELVVTDEDGKLFEYRPNNPESQRIQETLFHEKETIIENCLFGVDINVNSVKICRLRLWIELLKNAYYKQGSKEIELETLPNIDINIKCGNSLVSRFPLDADIKSALKKSNQWTIGSYRLAVQAYREAENKEQKRAMIKLIEDIKNGFSFEISNNDPKKKKLQKLELEHFTLLNQHSLFEETQTQQKERKQKQQKLELEIDKLNNELKEIESSRIYENAFEWRFEFPEVLDENGDFTGFDMIIGNPPYIRQEEISSLKPYLKENYSIYHSIADILTYFVELGHNILKPEGTFQFIISNKFTRTDYGQVMRSFLLEKTSLTHFVDFSGLPVFDEATVDAAILGFVKQKPADNAFIYLSVVKEQFLAETFNQFVKDRRKTFSQNQLSEGTWAFEDTTALNIKHKIEEKGVRLKNWSIQINRGVLTGYNEAFIIDRKTRDELIEKDPKSAEILKPILRGRDIQKYYADYQDLWLIYIPWHFPLHEDTSIEGVSEKAETEFLKRYPAIYIHLEKHKENLLKRNKAETNIRYEWYAMQRFASNYWQDFEKPKVVWKRIGSILRFCYDEKGYFCLDSTCIATGAKMKYLCAVLNSKLCSMELFRNSPKTGTGDLIISVQALEPLHVPIPDEKQEHEIVSVFEKILSMKKNNSDADTGELEAEIDRLVYALYGLTEEEIAVVESAG